MTESSANNKRTRRILLFVAVALFVFVLLPMGVFRIRVAMQDEGGSAQQAPAFTDGETSFTWAGDVKNTSYGSVRRYSRPIVVPLGRSREALRATLERAARELARERRADAVMVFAYRPQDEPTGVYTAARATLAPGGEWSEAGSGAPKKIVVDFSDLYFAPPPDIVSVGASVILRDSTGRPISLSRLYGSWMDEDIVARVPSGTRATVIDRRSEPLGDKEFVRYRVQVEQGGTKGWVHERHVTSD